jgi:hypothetical protein
LLGKSVLKELLGRHKALVAKEIHLHKSSRKKRLTRM